MSKPSPHPVSHDFDFLLDRWRVRNERLKKRLADCREWETFDARMECRPLLGGLGNMEEHVSDAIGDTRWIGMALRLFDPRAQQWSIWWADNRRGALEPPVVGGFVDGVGIFTGRDHFEGAPIVVRFVWDAREPAQPRWEQAFSKDDGTVWETNWVMRLQRETDASH